MEAALATIAAKRVELNAALEALNAEEDAIREEFGLEPREAAANYTKQRVLKELLIIRINVESKVLRNESKYIYEIRNDIKHGFLNPCNNSFPPVVGCLKELLEAIKISFPDCSILIDPLETYIIIDWS